MGYCNPPDLCYTLSITRRGRKRGHHPKETTVTSMIAGMDKYRPDPSEPDAIAISCDCDKCKAEQLTAELRAAITPDIHSNFDGRIDVLTATRVYFIYTRMMDGAREGRVVFQPINAKTGKPWQAWREIKGLTNWATPWLPFAYITAGVAAHITAAGLAVDDIKWLPRA